MSRQRPQLIGYGRQSIDRSDLAAVVKVLRKQPLTCGPAVVEFERAIERIAGARYAVAVSNGTSALRLLYQVAGVGPGTAVGVPAITFVATASQALLLGAEVVLLDVDPQSGLLTPEILRACRERLDFVVPVHLAGLQCDLRGLAAICRKRRITMIEDAAHAFGSTWKNGGRCGDCTHSRGAVFSFHPVKNITTGEGGAIVTNNAKDAEKLRQLRHHGIVRAGFNGGLARREGTMPWYHEFHQAATNERLSDIHAALGVSQCRRLEKFKRARAAIVRRYRRELAALPWLTMPPEAEDQDPCWHLFQVRVDWKRIGISRERLWRQFEKAGYAPQVHYIPLRHQPVLAKACRAGDLTNADHFYARTISLPCYPDLKPRDQGKVIAVLKRLAH